MDLELLTAYSFIVMTKSQNTTDYQENVSVFSDNDDSIRPVMNIIRPTTKTTLGFSLT